MSVREFRMGKGAKTLVWRISMEGDSYVTEHGMIDGKLQKFSDTPGDKGKVGTQAYVSPEENMAFHVDREIRKKLEHGYVEFVNGKPTTEQVTELNFSRTMPKNFCGYKPQTDIDPKALAKLHNAGLARYSRKYDGMSHVLVHHHTGWEIYSRRMDLATERFPNHIKELEGSDLKIGTVIVGEMVCQRQDGTDDFKAISRVCRSDPEEARKLIESGECPEPKFFIFDMLFFNGTDLKNKTYDERAVIWRQLGLKLINPVEYFKLTPTTWEAYAKKHNWEGFVVTDGSSVPGDKFYSFDGDAKRPKGHHKLKPKYTEDVVVYAAVKGSGKRLDTVGAVFTKQIHPETGKWMSTGKCGSGFTESDLAEIEKLCLDNEVPILDKDKEAESLDLSRTKGLITIEMEYGERQPGSNKFRFPVFMRIRFDKKPSECYAQRLAPEEE